VPAAARAGERFLETAYDVTRYEVQIACRTKHFPCLALQFSVARSFGPRLVSTVREVSERDWSEHECQDLVDGHVLRRVVSQPSASRTSRRLKTHSVDFSLCAHRPVACNQPTGSASARARQKPTVRVKGDGSLTLQVAHDANALQLIARRVGLGEDVVWPTWLPTEQIFLDSAGGSRYNYLELSGRVITRVVENFWFGRAVCAHPRAG
jgi:hypothetical protein